MAEITKPNMAQLWASGGAIIAPASAKISLGWTAEIPPHQWENWIQNRQDRAIGYLFQRGIAEWDESTEYFENKSVTVYQGNLYLALQDSVSQIPSSTSEYWASFLLSTNSQDAGEVKFFARSTTPVGYLKANGDAVLRTLYPNLDTAIYVGDTNNATAIFGYRCTNPANPGGSRSTTGQYIVVPDMRGEFARGWDDGRGVDPGRSFGSSQGHALLTHNHTASTSNSGGHTHTGSTTTAGSHRHPISTFNDSGGGGPTIDNSGQSSDPFTVYTEYEGDHSHGVNLNVDGVHNHTVTVNNYVGANETRPRNIALLACIKY